MDRAITTRCRIPLKVHVDKGEAPDQTNQPYVEVFYDVFIPRFTMRL